MHDSSVMACAFKTWFVVQRAPGGSCKLSRGAFGGGVAVLRDPGVFMRRSES